MSRRNRAPEMNPDLTPEEVAAEIERLNDEWRKRAEGERADREHREAA